MTQNQKQNERRRGRSLAGLCIWCGKEPSKSGLGDRCKEKLRLRARTPQYKQVQHVYREGRGHSWYKEVRKKNHQQHRIATLEAYGKRCQCCGETQLEFLTIDHILGWRATLAPRSGNRLYRWLRNNSYPEGFQVLCWNCNCAKGIMGGCPHRTSS